MSYLAYFVGINGGSSTGQSEPCPKLDFDGQFGATTFVSDRILLNLAACINNASFLRRPLLTSRSRSMLGLFIRLLGYVKPTR
jgi:hypothetical protein